LPISYDQITTTIEREPLAEIIAGTKKIEYGQIKPYWTKRFEKVSLPPAVTQNRPMRVT
jgi:hypothetical protein